MRVDRRDFLRTLGGIVFGFEIGQRIVPSLNLNAPSKSEPVTMNSSRNREQKLVLKTSEAKLCLETICCAACIPIVGSVSDLPNAYPDALNADGVKYCEVVVENIILHELVGRSKNNFLPELIRAFPRYNQDLLEGGLFLCLHDRAQRFLNEIKGIPSYLRHDLTTKYSYMKGRDGIFTDFTEQEAENIAKSIAKIPFEEIRESVKKRLNSDSRCQSFWDYRPGTGGYVLAQVH